MAVNWIWYAAPIGLPLLVHAVAIGLNMAAGATPPSFDQFSTKQRLPPGATAFRSGRGPRSATYACRVAYKCYLSANGQWLVESLFAHLPR
jgi:hypothetical protein